MTPTTNLSSPADGRFEVVAGDLSSMDRLTGDSVGLFLWSDVRPLRGMAGFADWRMCGAVSNAIEAGYFSGSLGDNMLMLTAPRMGHKRVFVFGLGPEQQGSEQLRQGVREAIEVLKRAKVERVTLLAPHGATDSDWQKRFVGALEAELDEGLKVERVLIDQDEPN